MTDDNTDLVIKSLSEKERNLERQIKELQAALDRTKALKEKVLQGEIEISEKKDKRR